jgi:error-prone DNA polymerase
MFACLHAKSCFSFLYGSSTPEQLVEEAFKKGITALALTDRNGVYGAVRFQQACAKYGIKPIFGAEVMLDGAPLVLLAEHKQAYFRLCSMLSVAHHRNRLEPHLSWQDIEGKTEGIIAITGFKSTTFCLLLEKGDFIAAQAHAARLLSVFNGNVCAEIVPYFDQGWMVRKSRIAETAALCGLIPIAGMDVLYAHQDHYAVHDLLVCIQELITVFEPHPLRPKNALNTFTTKTELAVLLSAPSVWFENAIQIAKRCSIDLIPGVVTPPVSTINAGVSPDLHLRLLCEEGLSSRYGKGLIGKASELLEKELSVIHDLELEDYFLVVYEIVMEARRRQIRCSGRGSAANSIVCYLLGITKVDPLQHNLLFERFLHRGRKGTPDIDIDFDTERRQEILDWIVERFGYEHTAMTATLAMYQLRSAFRDCAKALGFQMDIVNTVSKLLPHYRCGVIEDYRPLIESHMGSNPLSDVLIRMVAQFEGIPRHLGLHSGGMVLGRESLFHYTPVQVSANGLSVVQFDKDDVEKLGLIKFDILGLRMLSCISEAVEHIERHELEVIDPDTLPLDDPATFELIRSGDTVGVFQIESQGQMHLLAKNQPETFDDIIAEIALFRPGPLQGGVVYPFVNRRRGKEPVEYLHPSLEPILRDTYGIILFQEQVLEVVHQFAGLSLEEADRFRQLMSKFRDPGNMQGMRQRFVEGAAQKGITAAVADEVFEKVSKFVGYGFCRSHAAAFAHIVYQSAYLKVHHPASFMAAFMQVRPGMYNQMTLDQEARKFGVRMLLPNINRSGLRFDLERMEGKLSIRKPLTIVTSMDDETARAIVIERMNGSYRSIEELQHRTKISSDTLLSLARGGALDCICGSTREAVWKAGLISRRRCYFNAEPDLFTKHIDTELIPEFPLLTDEDRLAWDYQTHGAARRHPVTLLRRQLIELEIRSIEQAKRLQKVTGAAPYNRKGAEVSVAGIVILRQRPGTAKGFMFLTLEDETGFIQCVVSPQQCELFGHVLYHSSLIVKGSLGGEGNWTGLYVKEAWLLNSIFGGYEGRPSETGGKDKWVRSPAPQGRREGVSIRRPWDKVGKAQFS